MTKLKFAEFSAVSLELFEERSVDDLKFDLHNAIFVTDGAKLGVITDGDVRRAVRKFGYSFSPCSAINWDPEILDAPEGISKSEISDECRKILAAKPNIKIIPVRIGKIFRMFAFKDIEIEKADVTVVIMARAR